jgi:hypothetical protein
MPADVVAPPLFVLCFETDPSVKLYWDRASAESAMEIYDLDSWTVYDGEGYRRALSPRGDGALTIGARMGDRPADEAAARLREHLSLDPSLALPAGASWAELLVLAAKVQPANPYRTSSWPTAVAILIAVAAALYAWLR